MTEASGAPSGAPVSSNLPMIRSQRRKDQNGTSTLEFLVVLPTLLFVLFAIIEFSRLWLMVNLVTTASREGARVGVVTPTLPGDAFNSAPAEAKIDDILGSADSRTVTCPTPCISGSEVQATVQVTFDTVIPLLSSILSDVNISRTTRMRYE
jgi:Flp pilus assembly protein TadG